MNDKERKLWENIIKAIEKEFGVSFPSGQKEAERLSTIIWDKMDKILEGSEYGYCPDCDERCNNCEDREPMRNEGYD